MRRADTTPAGAPRRRTRRLLGACLLVPGVLAAVVAACVPAVASDPAAASGPAVPGIAAAPVRVAHTPLGAVGYRIVGHGTPLLLINGHAQTIDDWDPRFVDDLARRHRVIVPDTAGIGRTAIPPGGLTMDSMGDQAAALLSALHVARADVLGWSQGGMVAQDFAARHPDRLRRLVLAGTFPGDGRALPIPSQTLRLSAEPGELLATLFPADEQAAGRAYARRLRAYGRPEPVPAQAARLSGLAIGRWDAGEVAAGHDTLRVPTLVADGRQDDYVVLGNDRRLVAAIPGAQLVLYPDAGHAFLYQVRRFVARVQRFLGG